MTKPQRLPDYLQHIVKAIERIERYTADLDERTFLMTDLVQDAVLRNIEIIGEAANNIQRVAPEFASRHSSIPWQVMYAMRNRVTHGYDHVDLEIVWATIRNDLPALKVRIQQVAATLK